MGLEIENKDRNGNTLDSVSKEISMFSHTFGTAIPLTPSSYNGWCLHLDLRYSLYTFDKHPNKNAFSIGLRGNKNTGTLWSLAEDKLLK